MPTEGLKSSVNHDEDLSQSLAVGTVSLTRGGQLLGIDDNEYSTYSKDNIDVLKYDALSPFPLTTEQLADIFVDSDPLSSDAIERVGRMITPVKRAIVTATSSRAVSWQQDRDKGIDNGGMCMSSSLFESPTRPVVPTTKVVDISVKFHSNTTKNSSPIKSSASASSVFSPSVKAMHGYSNKEDYNKTDSDSVHACLSTSSEEDESDTPVHLIVMQHGFLGSSYDLRLLQNAVSVELPDYTHVSNLITFKT